MTQIIIINDTLLGKSMVILKDHSKCLAISHNGSACMLSLKAMFSYGQAPGRNVLNISITIACQFTH